MSDSPRAEGPNPGWTANERELRELRVEGYHSAQQLRTVETTRRLVAAAWDAMAAHPAEPVRLEEILAGSATSASSFYSRFDTVGAVVSFAGVLALAVDERVRAEAPARAPAPAGRPAEAIGAATDGMFASVLVPGRLPREVLAAGMWDETQVEARRQARATEVQDLASSAMDRGLSPAYDSATYHRAITWLHLAGALADQVWALGGLVLPASDLADVAAGARALGEAVFAPSAAAGERGSAAASAPHLDVPRSPLTGHSDRGARAVAELRDATHRLLLEQGRDLSPADIARSVHRSRTSFFDAFGSVGAALADLARAEQVARIPTELFRPRAGVAGSDLVAHLTRRIRAWQDHQSITGRRLLQAAAQHAELAAEVLGQLADSAELLAGWYGPMLDLPAPLARVTFMSLLAAEQHQVVWGLRPPVLLGPDALARVFEPVVVAAVSPPPGAAL